MRRSSASRRSRPRVGLTPRSIRYYEELGLLEPAARSDGDYRLFDASDLERLRFIKSLRDDAGFSLAQVGQMLEDEAARARNRERFAPPGPDRAPPLPRRALARVERQIDTLEAKADRIGDDDRGRARPPRPLDRISRSSKVARTASTGADAEPEEAWHAAVEPRRPANRRRASAIATIGCSSAARRSRSSAPGCSRSRRPGSSSS